MKFDGENMLLKSKIYSVTFLLIFLADIFLFQVKVSAIPAFARKYKTSCSTCHEAITKRNPVGESFRRNGYFFPINDANLIKEKPVKLGAEEWKEVWPDAIWPGDLPESLPIAAFTMMRVNYDMLAENKGHRFEFAMPVFLNLLFGETFGEDVAFFGEWSALGTPANEGIEENSYQYVEFGLQRLFIQFNSVAGTPNLLNIRVGRLEPAITDGYTSSQKLTASYPITMDYDPGGGWKARDPQSGIELNGIYQHRIYYAMGVVNGESKTIADPADQKDFYARLAYQFGGDGFDGKDSYNASGKLKNSESFVTVGANTYLGSRDRIPLNNITYNNYFKRYGFDFNFHLIGFDLLAGTLFGSDNNPDNDSRVLNSSAYFVELNYSFYPWMIGLIRYEKAEASKSNEDRDNFINIIPNLTMLYRANIRFSLEGMIRINKERKVNGVVISPINKKPFQFVNLNLMFAF